MTYTKTRIEYTDCAVTGRAVTGRAVVRRYRLGWQFATGWALLAPFCLALWAGSHKAVGQVPGVEAAGVEEGPPREQAARLLAQANRSLEARDFEKAAAAALQGAELITDSAAVAQQAAEILYLAGKPAASLPLFDRVVQIEPAAAAHNWQRGIAVSTCGDFAEGARQFKQHHDVNPDDVENSAWYFLCIAKTEGIAAARKTVIPSRGDSRQPMMSVLQMLKGELEPEAVVQATLDRSIPDSSRPMAQFYADLYVGLYYDSIGESDKAIEYLQRSLSYGRTGYMVRTAEVYLAERFPDGKPIATQVKDK